jgi:hypothetical protein
MPIPIPRTVEDKKRIVPAGWEINGPQVMRRRRGEHGLEQPVSAHYFARVVRAHRKCWTISESRKKIGTGKMYHFSSEE